MLRIRREGTGDRTESSSGVQGGPEAPPGHVAKLLPASHSSAMKSSAFQDDGKDETAGAYESWRIAQLHQSL